MWIRAHAHIINTYTEPREKTRNLTQGRAKCLLYYYSMHFDWIIKNHANDAHWYGYRFDCMQSTHCKHFSIKVTLIVRLGGIVVFHFQEVYSSRNHEERDDMDTFSPSHEDFSAVSCDTISSWKLLHASTKEKLRYDLSSLLTVCRHEWRHCMVVRKIGWGRRKSPYGKFTCRSWFMIIHKFVMEHLLRSEANFIGILNVPRCLSSLLNLHIVCIRFAPSNRLWPNDLHWASLKRAIYCRRRFCVGTERILWTKRETNVWNGVTTNEIIFIFQLEWYR